MKLSELPFFTGVMPSNSLATTLKAKQDNGSANMWQQTVAQYVISSLEVKPVSGDTVAINDEWALVIREVDATGGLRTIGLKRKDLPVVK